MEYGKFLKSVDAGASNIKNMNSAIQRVSSEANLVSTIGNNTEINANTGKEKVDKAVSKINSIKNVSSEISVNIGELGKT
ncbi:MAG: hypothetical protein M0C28_31365 [Candidatus Moduliflexus flocculans]|nr:hypothetical protein [Candidatus Moduliflexus flocculans]